VEKKKFDTTFQEERAQFVRVFIIMVKKTVHQSRRGKGGDFWKESF